MEVKGEFKVTFNMSIGDYEVGECRMNTVDFIGDDITSLAQEVVDSDPSFPMIFKEVGDSQIVGLFLDAEDPDEDRPVAVMY